MTTLKTSTKTTSTSTHSATPTSTAFADCLGSKKVPVDFISSAGFSQLAQPYNLRLPYAPAAIVLPTTNQHVSDAVVCAAKSNLKVQAKSGGHSYASFSSGGQDGSVIIDLQSFQNISVDAKGLATVGGGVRLGNLATGIYNLAKRALPHGTCPGVGIGGHATHGGYGYSSRTWGLALDSIVGLDVVLANGSFIHATSTAYTDIYYALRGAADSFGIVTTFYLQTQPAPTSVTNWSFSLPNIFSSATTATNALLHIQDFATNASVIDAQLGFGIYMDGTTFSISGTYFGSQSHFTSVIQPELLRTLPTPASSTVTSNTWLASLTKLAGNEPLTQPTTGYSAHDDFFAKSLVVPESSPLTSAGLTAYFNYIITHGISNAPSPWFSIINLYGGPSSAINAIPSSSAAYADRGALWVIQHYGYTGNTGAPFPTGIVPFVDGLNSALTGAQPQTVFGGYANYVDPSLSAAQAHKAYFGDAVYARLVGIKKVVDPAGVFWNPQAVGTS